MIGTRIHTTSIKSDQSISSAAVELEQCVLQQFAAVECDGEVRDLDVSRARVHGQGTGARPCFRVHLCFFLELQA